MVFTFIAEKKIGKKNLQFFFPYTKVVKQKKIAISKISNNKFRKIHYFANIKYKRDSRKYCEEKSSQKYFCEKKNFRQKKFDYKNFQQKKIVEKIFVQKNFRKK